MIQVVIIAVAVVALGEVMVLPPTAPVPCACAVRLPTCSKGKKIRARCSDAMPGPVSCT